MKKLMSLMVIGLGVLAVAGVAMAENTLEVVPEAAMNSTNYGLKVMIDPGSLDVAYVQSDHPQAESHFRVSFWLDVTNLDLPVSVGNKKFVFMKFYRDAPGPRQHTFVYIARNNADTAWRIALIVRKDNLYFENVGAVFLSNDGPPTHPQFIEIEWQQASAPGANDGIARLWRNGSLKLENTAIPNSSWNVDQVSVGIPLDSHLGPLASGFFYFDEYVSTR